MNTKDVRQLLRQVEREGGVVTRAPNGHWRIYNPATHRSAQITASPSDYRSLRNALVRLRRIGLLTEPSKNKKRKDSHA